MTVSDVIQVVGRLEEAGLNFWLDGGWGVDALLGEQTRPHDDMDMVVELRAIDDILALLKALGFALSLDDRPTRLVVADERARRIDIHPITLDSQGDGVQTGAGPGGGDAIYPAAGLAGEGTVGGRHVRCLTPELQLVHHCGYAPLPKDRHNVRVLCEHFNLQAPRSYRE